MNTTTPPFYYDYHNVVQSLITPSSQKIHWSPIACFFRRYKLQQMMSVFEWTTPEWWDLNYFLYTLYSGYVCIIRTPTFGVIPQMCELEGFNVFYQPAQCRINNPIFQDSLLFTIDQNCVLIRMTCDYGSIFDIIDFFGDLLAMCIQTGSTNLLNSQLAYIIASTNQSQSATFKNMFDKILSGEVNVVIDKQDLNNDGKIPIELLQQNLSQNFIFNDILEAWNTIDNMFDSFIGIPNANTQKKERLISDEVNIGSIETRTLADMWMQGWKKEINKAKQMFGYFPFDVKWRTPPQIGGENNSSGDFIKPSDNVQTG